MLRHAPTRRHTILGFALALFTLAGAAAPTTGQAAEHLQSSVGGCDVSEKLGFCYDYIGSFYTAERSRIACDAAPGGVFLEGGCPRENFVGTCIFDYNGMEKHRIYYYFYNDMYDLEMAKLSCPGTFIPK